jgi:hypothetical protein
MVFLGFQATSAPNKIAITIITSCRKKGHIALTKQEHFANEFNIGQFILSSSLS